MQSVVGTLILGVCAVAACVWIHKKVQFSFDKDDEDARDMVAAQLVSSGMSPEDVHNKIKNMNWREVAQWHKDGCWMTDRDGYIWAYGQRTGFPPIKMN